MPYAQAMTSKPKRKPGARLSRQRSPVRLGLSTALPMTCECPPGTSGMKDLKGLRKRSSY